MELIHQVEHHVAGDGAMPTLGVALAGGAVVGETGG